MDYKLSPSDLTYLYDGCQYCFYLKAKHNIAQPSMPMPGIFSAIAGQQKEFYAGKRTETFCRELPPGVVEYGEQWVRSQPIATNGIPDRCYIKGRFDAVVKFDDGTHGIIDFKTASPSEKKARMYGRQLHAYTYALENPADNELKPTPITRLGLLFFEPSGFAQLDLTRQAFNGNVVWTEVKRNDTEFIDFLHEVMKTLTADHPPKPASDCVWCQYRKQMSGFGQKPGARDAEPKENTDPPPLCPKCDSPMRLRNGRYGEFWSCPRFPDCRGTRKLMPSVSGSP